jgi:hypothetical protein
MLRVTILSIITLMVSLSLAGTTALCGDIDAPGIKIKTGVDRDSVLIGDRIEYAIDVTTAGDTELEFPDYPDPGGLEVKDFRAQDRSFLGRKTVRQVYVLSTLEPGEYIIPSSALNYRLKGEEEWRSVTLEEVAVEVKSVLAGVKGAVDIRDIKGPLEMRDVLVTTAIWLAILILLAALAGAFIFTKRKIKEMVPPPKPAHVIAYEALEDLTRRGLIAEGRIKEFYIDLSGIVRHYLEDRFRLKAPEMTTEEFLADVKQKKVLTSTQKELLRDFMSHCDLVKFARYGPTEEEIRSSVDSAKNLIDQTKEETAVEDKI